MKKLLLIIMLGITWGLGGTFQATAIFAASSVSMVEQEDRDFIRNLFQDKRYRYARQEATAYLQKYPSGAFVAEIIFIQAQIDVVREAFDLALKRYDKVIREYPDSPFVEDALYFAGALKIQLKRQGGDAYFDRLLKRFPDSRYQSRISFHLGKAAFFQKDWSAAETHFKAMLARAGMTDEHHLETQNYLAWTYYFKGETILARSLFFELLESGIGVVFKAGISFQLAVDAQQHSHYRKAITWYERQMQEWPHPDFQDRSRFWIAECLFLIHQKTPKDLTPNEIQYAVDLFTENLSLNIPFEPLNSRYHRGWLLLALKQDEAAVADFAVLQEQDKRFAADTELSLIRARFHERHHAWTQANQVYIQALAQRPEAKIRNQLLTRTIRNDYRRQDCSSIYQWSQQMDFSAKNPFAHEVRYYNGMCRFKAKEWEAAGKAFAAIPLRSEYGRQGFRNYLEVLQQLGEIEDGIALLDKAEKDAALGGRSKLLPLRIKFLMDLDEWPAGLRAMEQALVEIPAKKNDPWFYLTMAKTCDQIANATKDKEWLAGHSGILEREAYETKAVTYYQAAFEKLSRQDDDTRLSVLDILIERGQRKKDYKSVAEYYSQALQLIPDGPGNDTLKLRIANLYIHQLKDGKQAEIWLRKLHKKGKSEVHFEASTILAELYVQQKDYVKAIAILQDAAALPIQKSRWYLPVHFRLGELYQGREKWLEAVKHYDYVADSKGDSPLIQQARARRFEIKSYLLQLPKNAQKK